MKKVVSYLMLMVGALMVFACASANTEPVGSAVQAAHTEIGTGKHGVFFEPCSGTVAPYEHLSHFVYWDDPNVVLVGNLTTGISPNLDVFNPASPKEDAISFFEYSENVACQGKKCSDTQQIYFMPPGSSPASPTPLAWKVKPEDDLMDVVPFTLPGTDVRITCASFRVKGDKCRQVVQKLQDLTTQLGITYSHIVLNDADCN